MARKNKLKVLSPQLVIEAYAEVAMAYAEATSTQKPPPSVAKPTQQKDNRY